jgi:hypothetical protein
MGPKRPKVARTLVPTPGEKRPRRTLAVGHGADQVAWRFGFIDHGGRWDWTSMDTAKSKEIMGKMGEWEKKTWNEIFSADRANQHDVEVGDLIKDAQDRLTDLKLDDFDSLFRFRFSGKERLWGVKLENIFYIVWWDPNHEICPSAKR